MENLREDIEKMKSDEKKIVGDFIAVKKEKSKAVFFITKRKRRK